MAELIAERTRENGSPKLEPGGQRASTPSLRSVVREQIGAVGLAVRREALTAAALLILPMSAFVLLSAFPALQVVLDGRSVNALHVQPDAGSAWLAFIAGLVAPMVVWKGEAPFGETPLWSLPVNHVRHSLIKVGAGLLWLLTLVLGMYLWFTVVALLTGGGIGGVEETGLLIVDRAAAMASSPGGTELVSWGTGWWEWLLPFTAAATGYLFGSALVVGTAHPWRWVAALVLVFVGLQMLGDLLNSRWILTHLLPVRAVMFEHPLSLDVAVTGGVHAFAALVELPSGDRARTWSQLPSFGSWALATALWLGLGATALGLGAARHHER